MELQTKRGGAFEVAKKMFEIDPICSNWGVHPLTGFVDNKANVWLGNGEILKCIEETFICGWILRSEILVNVISRGGPQSGE